MTVVPDFRLVVYGQPQLHLWRIGEPLLTEEPSRDLIRARQILDPALIQWLGFVRLGRCDEPLPHQHGYVIRNAVRVRGLKRGKGNVLGIVPQGLTEGMHEAVLTVLALAHQEEQDLLLG